MTEAGKGVAELNRMLINFCPNCGQRADQVFNFCPQCGVKLPKEETVVTAETTAALDTSPIAQGPAAELTGRKGRRKTQSPAKSPQKPTASTPTKGVIPSPATPPIYKTIVEGPEVECMGRRGRTNVQSPLSSPKKQIATTPVKVIFPSPAVPPINKTFVKDAPREVCQTVGRGRDKRKGLASSPKEQSTPIKQELLESVTSPADISVVKGSVSPQKKRSKSISLEPLPVNQILTDNSGNKWIVVTLLSHNNCGLLYAAESTCKSFSGKQRYSVKLDAKNGRLYNEHVFLQRAAKKVTDIEEEEKKCTPTGSTAATANIHSPFGGSNGSISSKIIEYVRGANPNTSHEEVNVDKWKKSHEISFLGIPNCVGFGQHADTYRFLVFPDLGKSLQSVLDASAGTLSEKAIFQIAYRMLDVFEYIHENEYVHGDFKAEGIFVNPADLREVYLASYLSVFRYSPGGKHVAYLEGSRNSHEGTVEFISIDIHKGAGPSRRSDLEMLGYCVLKWFCGSLPWSKETTALQVKIQKERYKADVAALLKQSFGKKKHPDALKAYLEYVMGLKYEEKPDYDELRRIFAAPLDKIKASAYGPVDLKVLP